MSGEDLLRARGLRVTRPRLAVLEVLEASSGQAQGHLDVDQIAARVRARLDTVSTQAVYDVLSALSRAGLARRIEPAGSPARYESRVGDNHHHIVCRGCGEIADVDCAVGETPCLTPSQAHGFVLDEAEVTFWGLCPACQQRRADDMAAEPPATHTVSASHVATAHTAPTRHATPAEDAPPREDVAAVGDAPR